MKNKKPINCRNLGRKIIYIRYMIHPIGDIINQSSKFDAKMNDFYFEHNEKLAAKIHLQQTHFFEGRRVRFSSRNLHECHVQFRLQDGIFRSFSMSHRRLPLHFFLFLFAFILTKIESEFSYEKSVGDFNIFSSDENHVFELMKIWLLKINYVGYRN